MTIIKPPEQIIGSPATLLEWIDDSFEKLISIAHESGFSTATVLTVMHEALNERMRALEDHGESDGDGG